MGKTLDMGSIMLDFNQKTIEKEVTKIQAGNYALGKEQLNEDMTKTFIVNYVGRSDTDVKSRLMNHLVESKYKKFKFSYASSSKEAFEKECRNYHDFGESKMLDNNIHPDKPKGTTYKCPVCNI